MLVGPSRIVAEKWTTDTSVCAEENVAIADGLPPNNLVEINSTSGQVRS
jgi:hypothetical protein